jgi:DUF4097 and DUF4098 domain-containing protein YvlB
MKRKFIASAVFMLLAGLTVATVSGQDFYQTYALVPGDTISISNVSGEISVTGVNGSTVTVTAIREGRDKDLVQIEDRSSHGHLSLGVKYPEGGGNFQASVRFIVQVPMAAYRYDALSTASGDIKMESVAGEINARTASGDITISKVGGNVHVNTASGDISVSEAEGTVSANTASGDVEVELTRVDENGEFKIASVSGDVAVKAPMGLGAQVDMATVSGGIETTFPIAIEEQEGPGQKASGIVGSGTARLKLSTVSGNISLTGR